MAFKNFSVHSISTNIGTWISNQRGQDNNSAVLSYGAEILLGGLIKLILVFGLSFLFGFPKIMLIIVLTTGFFRILSGGAHCTAYYRCLLLSLMIFLGIGFLLKTAQPYLLLINRNYLFIPFIFCLYWITRWAPVAPENKPLKNEKSRMDRKKITLTAAAILLLLLYIEASKWWTWPIAISLLWQCFTLCPIGQKVIDKLDYQLTFSKGGAKNEKNNV